MICNSKRLRKPADPYVCPATSQALRFMTEHGRPGYEIHIQNAKAMFDEIQAEAGLGGPDCPVLQETLDSLDKEIWEAAQAAADRFDDWAQDVLP
jgi:hypothetical protein